MSNEPEQQPENPASEETQAPPATEDYAGYASLEEMRNAIYHSRQEGKRLAQQNAELAASQAVLLAQISGSKRTAERSAADEINDLGIPVDTLTQLVREIASSVNAEQQAPVAATNRAIAAISADTPDFAQLSPDFGRWLTANSDVEAAYQEAAQKSAKAAELALRGAFATFKETRKPRSDAPPKKVGTAGKLPTTQGSGAVRKDPETAKLGKEEMRELIKEARRTGSPVEMIRAIVGNRQVHRDIEPAKG